MLVVRSCRGRFDRCLGRNGRRNRCRRHFGWRWRSIRRQFSRHRRRRGSSRRRGTRFPFSLQLGQLIVLQFDQTLQFVHLTLQIRYAAFQLCIVTAGGVEAFLSHRQLVVQGFRIACGAFATGLARLGRDQAQVVPSGLRRSRFTTTTLGGIELLLPRSRLSDIATPLTPRSVLCSDFGNRLGLPHAGALRLIGHTQHLPGFQPVDVAVDKGIRVQRLDGQHGLLNRTAVTRLRRDFPEGIARRSGVLGRFGRTGDGRGHTLSRRGLRGCFSGLRREFGRVEQNAVITQQSTVGPHHLNQEFHHGFGERLAGSDTQDAFTTGTQHRSEGQVVEKRLAVDTGLGEIFR